MRISVRPTRGKADNTRGSLKPMPMIGSPCAVLRHGPERFRRSTHRPKIRLLSRPFLTRYPPTHTKESRLPIPRFPYA